MIDDFNTVIDSALKIYTSKLDDRDELAKLADTLRENIETHEMHKRRLKDEVNKLNKAYDAAIKNFYWKEKLFGSLSVVALVLGLVGTAFLTSKAVKPTAVIVTGIIIFIISIILYAFCALSHKKIADADIRLESALKLYHTIDTQCEKFTLIYGMVAKQVDLLMYKEIYESIYNIQEYLRNKDQKGFEAFCKAASALKIDISKFTK